MVLCTVALLAAGCANHDNLDSTSPTAAMATTAPLTGGCETTIGDRVWFDVNCNGIQDKEEVGGPEGVKVTLRNCDTGATYGTLTDANGYYQFNVPGDQNYIICIEIPGGYAATLEDEGGNDGIDSDINSEGCTACRFYECDKPNLTRDAGLCEKKDEGGEGCTPGFWRNHLSHWAATDYSPGDLVNDTFGCDLVADDGVTLGEAIDAPQTYGALVFHAIAGLLNATHPDVDYGLSASEVIDLACAGDKDTIAEENEEGCPLSGGNTRRGGPSR
jgi:hypothetical protein